MIEDPVTVLLNRAAVLLRELAEPGWERIAAGVIDAVRGAPRGGWPLRATHPSDSRGEGAISITDLVLRGALARAVRLDQVCVSSLIDIAVESTEVTRIRIELTVRYGSELRAVAEQVRTVAAAVVADLLGDLDAGRLVDVVVTDIVDADPLTDTGSPTNHHVRQPISAPTTPPSTVRAPLTPSWPPPPRGSPKQPR